jgi:hypothetical protein
MILPCESWTFESTVNYVLTRNSSVTALLFCVQHFIFHRANCNCFLFPCSRCNQTLDGLTPFYYMLQVGRQL